MQKILLWSIVILLGIQLIRPDRTNPPIDPKVALQAPKEVQLILKRSCYDCHSHETKWPWYSNIAPLSWVIIGHVNEGREALNFSNWTNIPNDIKEKRLKRAIKTTRNGMMPISNYLWIHKKAILSAEEKKVIEKWCQKEITKCQSTR